MYAFNGWAVFFYLHLDCLDGKQARRTKSSSPLGQLFDHGVVCGVCVYDDVIVMCVQWCDRNVYSGVIMVVCIPIPHSFVHIIIIIITTTYLSLFIHPPHHPHNPHLTKVVTPSPSPSS